MRDITTLSPNQLHLISLIELTPDKTLEALSRSTGYRPSTIAYSIERLKERGLIQRSAIVDFFNLGYVAHAIFFSLHVTREKEREEFVKYISLQKRVAWFGNLLGEYEYGLSLLVQHIGEAYKFLEEASTKSKVTVRDKVMTSRLSIHYFGRRYLYPTKAVRKPITIRWVPNLKKEVDEVDHIILRTLANDDIHSIRDLARKTGMSFASADRRVKKLRKDGIVPALIYSINAEQLGFESFRLLVKTRRMEESIRKSIFSFAQETPEVILLLESFGTWDYELGIEVSNMRKAMQVARQLSNRGVDWIENIQLLGENEDYMFSFYPF